MQLTEQRIREIVREELAAASTTAKLLEDEMVLIRSRIDFVEQRLSLSPELLQPVLTALRVRYCSLQSLMQQHE
jgi:hypothetical protein